MLSRSACLLCQKNLPHIVRVPISTELHALTLAAHSHTLHFNNASNDSLPGSELGATVPVIGDLHRPVTQFRAQKTIITFRMKS